MINCEHCQSSDPKVHKVYPTGTHNISRGQWARCLLVDKEIADAPNWNFREVCLTERRAKSRLTHYRNNGFAAAWSISRQYQKLYVILTAPMLQA